MSIDIKAPSFPESVTDGVVAAWRKQPGDNVKRGETLADIETDKVVFEIPATEDGVLEEIIANRGATVHSGQLLARLKAANASQVQSSGITAKPELSVAIAAGSDTEHTVSPSARKLMTEHRLTDGQVSGSGKGGRILKEDVLRVIQDVPAEIQPAETPTPLTPTPTIPEPSAPKTDEAPKSPLTGRPEKRVPMTRIRARIAERLVEAQHTAAMLTTFNEINMQPIMDLRQQYREKFEKEHGVRLGFMSFFVKAIVDVLKRFPEVNASIDGNDIVYHGFFDIGIAVSTPRGLVVPILRDADQLSMAEIETRIMEFAEKAQQGTLSMDEITGGTFTITNGGVFGSLLSTPILNPPQCGILGMHKIQQRPIVEDDKIVARPMMYMALTYDHRLIDGRGAVQFLVAIKELLEDPARMLLEV